MSEILTLDQAWLAAHVARGECSSSAAAARQLMDERIAGRADIDVVTRDE
jgi:hypothetical protein